MHVLRPLPLLALLLWPAGCGSSQGDLVPATAAGPRPILVLSIDTLRADAIGAYGGPAGDTPALDALAERSLVFERAYTQATHTHAAMSSVWTGLIPWRHGVLTQTMRLQPDVRSVVEHFEDEGWATAAFVTNLLRLLDLPRTVWSLGWGRGEGFGSSGTPQYLWDQAATDSALEWIEAQEGPYLAWLHLIDPHVLHEVPPDTWQFDREPARTPGEQSLYYTELEQAGEFPSPDEAAMIDELYRSQVRGVDRRVAQVVAAIEALPLERRPVLVVTSDHGEELFETWPKVGHGMSLTEGVLHVPLMVALPDGSRVGRVSGPVETLQVAPTLLELAGIEVPTLFDGPSLLAESPERGAAHSYFGRHATAVAGDARVWSFLPDLPNPSQVVVTREAMPWNEQAPWFKKASRFARLERDGDNSIVVRWVPRSADPERQAGREQLEFGLVGRFQANQVRLEEAEITDEALLKNLEELGYL